MISDAQLKGNSRQNRCPPLANATEVQVSATQNGAAISC